MKRSVKPLRHKTKGIWYANIGPWKNGRAGKVYAPTSVKTEKQAWAWLENSQALLRNVEASTADPTLLDLCQLYLAWSATRRDKGLISPIRHTAVKSMLCLLAETKPARTSASLGTMKAVSIDPHDFEAAIDVWQAKPYSPHYVDSIVRATKAVFAWAAKSIRSRSPARLISCNPLADVKPPPVPHSPERFAERSEIARFLRFFGAYARGSVDRGYKGTVKSRRHSGPTSLEARFDRLTILLERVLIHTGCRPGEACSALWTDVKWNGGTTSVGHSYAKIVLPPERWKVGGKTGKARTIYLSPTLSRSIRREFERIDRHPTHVFAHRCGPRDRLKGFARSTGAPWTSGALGRKILKVRRLAIAAGVAIDDAGPNAMRNYLFRHTAISTLLMMGIDVSTVASLTGTSEQMIRTTYGHLLDKHLASAAEAFQSRARR